MPVDEHRAVATGTSGVPQAVLSRALANVTGRTTKELITDRRMLEAARLLRFSEMSVGEIAFRAGYGDQLYFSRALKREHGESPSAYRARMRGRGPELSRRRPAST